MKKKFIFLTMMLLTFLGVNVLNAQEETITIGSGDKTNFRIPTNVYTKYSYCQQIYTQEELGIEAGVKITNISLKIATKYDTNRSWKVYMLNLEDKSSFDNAGWVSVTEDDVFYDGSVSLYGEVNTWININSEKGFEYNGGNLLLCIQDYTGTAPVQFYFYTYSSGVTNSCIRYTQDYGDPLTPDNISANGSRSDEKNQIIFTYESSVPEVMPSSVPEITSTEATFNSVTLSWGAVENAKEYNVYTSTGVLVETVNTTSCTIEGLEELTEYCYQVSAVNGDLETDKSIESCATTLEAPAVRDVVFVLSDIYDDGWMANNLGAYHTLTIKVDGVALKDLTIESGSSSSSETLTIDLGSTVTIEFNDNGSWENECSYCIYYDSAEGAEIVCSQNGGTVDGSTTYSFLVLEEGPENLTAEKTDIFVGDELKLSWDELRDAVSYNVYVDETMVETVTETSCTLDDLARNIDGYSIAVSANIGEGTETTETSKSNVIKVYVAGYTNLTVNVADTKDEVIEDAIITYSGKDVFENEISGNIADGNIRLKEGTYTIAVSKDGYVSSTEEVELLYNVPLTLDVILFKEGVFEVVAEFATNEWEQEVVKVEWTDSYEKYNVYRKNAMTGIEKKLTYSPTEENSYEDYETLYGGQYQYGVSTFETEVGEPSAIINIATPSTYDFTGNCMNYSDGLYFMGSGTYTMPQIVTETNGAKLSFDYLNLGCAATVKYATSYMGPWTTIYTIPSSSNFVTSEEIDLSSYPDNLYIAIDRTSTGEGIVIKNIKVVAPTISEVETEILAWSPVLVKEGDNAFVGGKEGYEKAWHVAENWSKAEVPGNGEDVVVVAEAEITTNVNVNKLTINNNVTIKSGGTLTITGTSHNSSINLEAGGQLVQNKEGVTGNFIIDVNEEWQFISLPIHNDYSYWTYTQFGLDLFKYDGNADLEWVNYMNEDNWTEYNFLSGVGYLVADGDYDTPHKFYGTFNAETTFSKELTYSAEKHLANFHLLGNPFTFDMKYDEIGFNNLAEGFAVVGDDGSYVYRMDNVKVGEGFFVKAKAENPSFTYGARSAKEKSAHINLIASGTAGEDNVIINFAGASEGFEKLDNFNKEIANIYVQDNAKRYGIYNVNDDVQEVIVKFDAKQMGQYTINAVTEGEFDMVTLVDRMTGIETDLLVEGYTFTATSNDNTDRFIVKFADKKQSEVSSSFVYQSGEELIINAEGTVQIIDVMGRMVYSNDVTNDNNRISVSELNNAAYIVRLINAEGVKVQKVVIY